MRRNFYLKLHFIENNVNDEIVYAVIDAHENEEAAVGAGVSRYVYSSFWSEVFDSYMIGVDERVPFVRHHLYTSEWEAMGMILI